MNIPNNAKCPKCSQPLATVTAGHVQATIPNEARRHHVVTYSCPQCQGFLGLELDPVAIKNDIVDALLEKLRTVQTTI